MTVEQFLSPLRENQFSALSPDEIMLFITLEEKDIADLAAYQNAQTKGTMLHRILMTVPSSEQWDAFLEKVECLLSEMKTTVFIKRDVQINEQLSAMFVKYQMHSQQLSRIEQILKIFATKRLTMLINNQIGTATYLATLTDPRLLRQKLGLIQLMGFTTLSLEDIASLSTRLSASAQSSTTSSSTMHSSLTQAREELSLQYKLKAELENKIELLNIENEQLKAQLQQHEIDKGTKANLAQELAKARAESELLRQALAEKSEHLESSILAQEQFSKELESTNAENARLREKVQVQLRHYAKMNAQNVAVTSLLETSNTSHSSSSTSTSTSPSDTQIGLRQHGLLAHKSLGSSTSLSASSGDGTEDEKTLVAPGKRREESTQGVKIRKTREGDIATARAPF